VPARRQRLRRRRRVTWREAPPACLHRRSADPSSSWPTPREVLDGGGPAARCSAGPEVDEQQVAVDLDLLHPGSSLASLASVACPMVLFPYPVFSSLALDRRMRRRQL
jgi:hypothetical protein